MPFVGLLAGASAILIVLLAMRPSPMSDRRIIAGLAGSGVVFALSFVVFWFRFFAGDYAGILRQHPEATNAEIVRGMVAQLEAWDFVVTALAFFAGGLLVCALAQRLEAATTSATMTSNTGNPVEAGLGGAILRQLRRITALNSLIVFALFVLTLPAVLPWVERRLEKLKVGDMEATFAPLAANTKQLAATDFPALEAKKNIANYLAIDSLIERAIDVIYMSPRVASSRRIDEVVDNYKYTRDAMRMIIVPQLARMWCIRIHGGVPFDEIPGVRETAAALLASVSTDDTDRIVEALKYAGRGLRMIETTYLDNYTYLGQACEEIEGFRRLGITETDLRREMFPNSIIGRLADGAERNRLVKMAANGYFVRLAIEFPMIIGERGVAWDARIESTYKAAAKRTETLGSQLTMIDEANLALLHFSQSRNVQYDLTDVLRRYVEYRGKVDNLIAALGSNCNGCEAPSEEIKRAAYVAGYTKVLRHFADADAVIVASLVMLRRLPLNRLDDVTLPMLEILLANATASRSALATLQDSEREWAETVLDEGIATIRYVLLVQGGEISAVERSRTCAAAAGRLEKAIDGYEELQQSEPEHRLNRARAERTLHLVSQFCGE